jgi:hypothetical protein
MEWGRADAYKQRLSGLPLQPGQFEEGLATISDIRPDILSQQKPYCARSIGKVDRDMWMAGSHIPPHLPSVVGVWLPIKFFHHLCTNSGNNRSSPLCDTGFLTKCKAKYFSK